MMMMKSEDTADDAAGGPQADEESDPEHSFGVYVWLHMVRDECVSQDVERPHTKCQHCTHQVHREQCCLLHTQGEREKKRKRKGGGQRKRARERDGGRSWAAAQIIQ